MSLPSSTHTKVACLMTMFNLVCGFMALVSIAHAWYKEAALLILLAAVFDSVDGRIARRGNGSTDMGKELDSLCDLVSFGAAPALLVTVQLFSSDIFIPVLLAAVFYVVCGAYRLARFNIASHPDYFTGVPITLAGMATAILAWLGRGLPEAVMIITLLVLGFFMISTIKVPKNLSRSASH